MSVTFSDNASVSYYDTTAAICKKDDYYYPRRKRSTTASTKSALRSPRRSSIRKVSYNKNSISSTAGSKRVSSTPLADRFMPPNYKNSFDIITPTEAIKEEEIIEAAKGNIAPGFGSSSQKSDYDRLVFLLPTPPPLFLSSYNDQLKESYHHPLDIVGSNNSRRKKSVKHHHCRCSKKKQLKRTSKCSEMRNDLWWKGADLKEPPQKKKQRRRSSNNKVNLLQKPIIKPEALIIEIDETQQAPIEKKQKKADDKKKINKNICCCFIQRWQEDNNNRLLSSDTKRRTGCFCFCGKREWVILIFLCVILSIVLAFVFWPRIPLIRVEGAELILPTKVTQTQHNMVSGGSNSTVAFESTWLLNITVDNRCNYVTTRFNRIQIITKDAMTGLLVGKGLEGDNIYLDGHTISTIQLPISVNYQAPDGLDTTFSNLIRACTNNSTTGEAAGQHHSLSIQFWFTLYLFGLDWFGYKPSVIATPATGGFFCPSS